MTQHDYATHWRQVALDPSAFSGHLREAMRRFVVSAVSFIDRRTDDSFLRCLYCHYVFDDQKDDFANLLITLKGMGHFITTDTCVQMLKGQRPIDGKYFHLSFDDGFRNNFTNAFPILKAHNVPAIFFVPSSLIEAQWTVASNYCLNTARYHAVIEMLRWDDLLEMIASGYEIGSHTKTHARFSSVSGDKVAMDDEIRGSKHELEERLTCRCKYISWPYGTLTDADEYSLDAVRNAGYEACFGAYRGSVIPGSTSVFSIPRHHFEVQWPISHIKYFARGNRENKT